jgi:hypothetical protein
MAVSFGLWGGLGPAYRPEVFWRDIPSWLGSVENLSRFGVIGVSSLMLIQLGSRRNRAGLALYLIGLALYTASYAALIGPPESAWALSFWGFAAPACTPAAWIAGIGLLGSRSAISRIPSIDRLYFLLSAVFLVSHILHTSIVYGRTD